MAQVQNTLIGRAKGRVGNLVFSTWKGRNIIKQKPEIVANPRSSLQQSNRARFNLLLALGLMLRPIIAAGFREYAGQMSWLNKFMQTNSYNGLFSFVDPDWIPDYDKLVISEGSLYQRDFTISAATATDVTITWNTALLANQADDDKVFIFVIGKSTTAIHRGVVDRSAGTDTVTIAGTAGDTVTVAMFFMRSDGLIVSNSYAHSDTIS